jgi:hypothetical protein
VEYDKLLDDQFQFFFNPDDGLEQYFGPAWDRQHELSAAAAIFSGDTGYDRIKQESIPPVLSIEFGYLLKIRDWSDPGTDPLYAGTLRATYRVGMKVLLAGVEQTVLITGDNVFYVTAYSQADSITVYKIKIWEDGNYGLGTKALGSASAGTSWGRLKSLWAAPDPGKQ